MILFMLKCPSDHRFEVWFKDGSAYERQAKRGLISCPVCQSTEIAKAPMAPRISKGLGNKEESTATGVVEASSVPVPAPPSNQTALAASPELLTALREVVEKHCENVGPRFAEEARRIHYGESENRGIIGQSSPEETQSLLEEGIEVMPLPWPSRNG
ncbi:MAG: DUF1178 family protein [Rhodospirillales bacterium]|jgi:hypothetical protein|nr:DUF1178 family protein [Rhodospirillales bacterium]